MADVLAKGLSRASITTSKLKGVKTGQRTQEFILVRPLAVKVKAYPVSGGIAWVSITRERIRLT